MTNEQMFEELERNALMLLEKPLHAAGLYGQEVTASQMAVLGFYIGMTYGLLNLEISSKDLETRVAVCENLTNVVFSHIALQAKTRVQ